MDIETLLCTESPLLLRPTLACVLDFAGLKPADRHALWTQRVDFWIRYHQKNGHTRQHKRDGRWWVWNTIDGWQAQFPFWSRSTIKRVIACSVQAGVTVTANYNPMGYDRTLWYTVDHDRVAEMALNWERAQAPADEESVSGEPMDRVQLSQSIGSDRANGSVQNEPIDRLTVSQWIGPDRANGSVQNEPIDRLTVSQPIPEIPIDSAEKERQRVWSLACKELEMQMTRATFATWVRQLRLAELTGRDGAHQAVLYCSNAYVQDWCRHRLGVRIHEVLAGVLGVPTAALEVRYEV